MAKPVEVWGGGRRRKEEEGGKRRKEEEGGGKRREEGGRRGIINIKDKNTHIHVNRTIHVNNFEPSLSIPDFASQLWRQNQKL